MRGRTRPVGSPLAGVAARTRGLSWSLALLVALALAFSSPATAQITIDDFSTAQALLTAPPEATSTVAGAGIVGGTRDLLLDRLSGAGNVTLEVSGGDLVLTPGAGNRALAVTTWDADSDPSTLDPAGLGGIDLMAGGASAFVFSLVVTTSAELEIEVYDVAGNSSRAGLLVGAGSGDELIDFGELRAVGPTAADLTNVGAIVFTLRAEDGTVTASNVSTALPDPAAIKVDALTVDGDSDGNADPGDRVTYTITITNTGGRALTVDLDDMVDGNTTLVAGSTGSTPIPLPDQYTAVGNTTLMADGGAGRPGLLANDQDPDGDLFTVTSFDAMTAQGGTVSNVDPATGTFDYVPASGFRGTDSFNYTVEDDDANMVSSRATVVVEGVIWFVDNTHGGPFEGTQANPFATMKAAEMAAGRDDIIRVREGDGTDTGHDEGFIMKVGQRIVGGAADLVVGGQLIEAGTGDSVHSHGAGNVFDLAGDHVIEGLTINPTTGHGLAGTGVSEIVADDVVINPAGTAGGIRLTNHSGSFTFSNGAINGANAASGRAVEIIGGSGVFSFPSSSIAHNGGGLIHVSGNSGVLDFSGTNPTLTAGSDHGINLDGNAGGSITFDTLGPISTSSGSAVRVVNSGSLTLAGGSSLSTMGGAALDITGTTVVAGLLELGAPIVFSSLTASGGTIGVNLVGVAPSMQVTGTTSVSSSVAGVNLATGGAVQFNTLNITSTAGHGLRAMSTGLVTVTNNASAISSTGGPALDIGSTQLALVLGSVSANPGAGGRGVSLVGATGSVTTTGGAITGSSAASAFHVDGGSLTASHGGTVTQTNAQRAVDIFNTTGGTITLAGKVTGGASSTGVRVNNADGNTSFADLDLGTSGAPMTNQALTLTGGSTGTHSFASTQIFTTGATGMNADNGGVVQVTGTGNRVSATSARAITFENGTTIGGLGATFERVDASGTDRGIRLSSAGSGFTITGDGPNGTNGTGGTISNITQRGIEVLSTNSVTVRNVTLSNAATTNAAANCTNLTNTGCHAAIHLASMATAVLDNVNISGSVQQGINGNAVAGFSLQNSSVTNGGDEVNEGCLRILALSGTSDITDSDLSFPSERVAYVENTNAANLGLTVSGSTFRDTQSSGLGADGLELNFFGTSTASIDVVDSFFRRNRTNGLQIFAQGSSVVDADITGSTFDREAGIGIGMDLAASDTGQLTFNVIGNPTINSRGGSAVNVFSDNNSVIAGRILNNPNIQLGGATTSGIGIAVQVNESARGTVDISGNTVSNVGFDAGIQVIARLLGGAACGTTCTAGRLDATITGNTVTVDPTNSLYDIWVQANDSNTTCADVRNNTVSGVAIAAFRERTNAANSTVLLEGFNTDAATTWAGNGNTPAGSVSSSNNGTLAGGTCVDVSHPMP